MKEDNRIQIEKDMEDGTNMKLPRHYLGMSSAGHPCARYLWYGFRWCYTEDITKQHQRIYDRGHLEEPRVVVDLKKAGYEIVDSQLEFVGFAGHCKGHCDGSIMLNGKKHVLEIKTMKQEKFKVLKKDKMKKANPGYWGQAQMYMAAMMLKKCLFIVTNKNTEERYYEVVEFDEHQAKFFEDRIADVIATEVPLPKIGNADWFECKWCDAAEVCQYEQPHVETCRTCQHVCLVDKGEWHCVYDGHNVKILTIEQQQVGCGEYDAFKSLSE